MRLRGSLCPGEERFTARCALIGKAGGLASVTSRGIFEGTAIDVTDPRCDGGEYAGTYQGAFRFAR